MFRIRLQPLVAAVIIMAAKMEARWESIKRTSLLNEGEETGDYFSCPVLFEFLLELSTLRNWMRGT